MIHMNKNSIPNSKNLKADDIETEHRIIFPERFKYSVK